MTRRKLIESWARQQVIRQSIIELAEIGKQEEPKEALRQASQSTAIRSQLKVLSGHDDVKFVVWNREGNTLASWQEEDSPVGTSIAPSGAANLARVMRGETVLLGPVRMYAEDPR